MTRLAVLGQFTSGVALLLPGVVLAYFGIAHFLNGVAVDAAVPIPVYMVAEISVPKLAYVEAAKALAKADPDNGGALLSQAEARIRAGEAASVTVPLLRDGLGHEPASARGWALLAKSLRPERPAQAARALSLSFLTSPRDYWIAGSRTRDAALLWPYLDQDTRNMAIEQTQLLWQEPQLRPRLLDLASAPTGAALASRAFGPDDIRDINRWMSKERRRVR